MVSTELLLFSQVAVDNEIDNYPKSIQVLKNLIQLRDTLISLEKLLDVDIIINSGYRCPLLNDKVKGSKNSYHMYGLAADITIANTGKCTLTDLKDLCRELRKTRFTEVVIHDTYIHVAIKKYV